MNCSYDDLISEENEDVQTALKRLTPKESYDRVFRLRRATQLSLQQKVLPREAWTKPEDDVAYVSQLLAAVEAEAKEREDLDTIVPLKAH
jgi:ubiquinol-cytochrome c reductase subunit 7